MKLAIAIVCALLTPTALNAKKGATLRERIAGLHGQPLSAATSKLGLPASKMEMGANTVYSWHKANVFSGYDAAEKPLECTIRLSVDATGVIQTGDVDGNRGACDIFAKQLS